MHQLAQLDGHPGCGILLKTLSLITRPPGPWKRKRQPDVLSSRGLIPSHSKPLIAMPIKFLKELFGQSDIATVAEQLANELSRRYPPAMASGEGRKLSPQAVTNILESVINKAVTKSQEWDLGVVGKAKLGNSLRWALKEKGYPEKFIEMVTEALVVYLGRQGNQSSAKP